MRTRSEAPRIALASLCCAVLACTAQNKEELTKALWPRNRVLQAIEDVDN